MERGFSQLSGKSNFCSNMVEERLNYPPAFSMKNYFTNLLVYEEATRECVDQKV